jgi:transcriptional regulator with XRE-family HTH domain
MVREVHERGDFAVVTAETRGEAIRQRRMAFGLRSVREFAERTGLARETVTRAEHGEASEGTYQRLEAWLDAFEHEIGADEPAAPVSIEQIEFTVEGDFGVKVTVKGPINDRAQLEESVTRIIRSIRDGG